MSVSQVFPFITSLLSCFAGLGTTGHVNITAGGATGTGLQRLYPRRSRSRRGWRGGREGPGGVGGGTGASAASRDQQLPLDAVAFISRSCHYPRDHFPLPAFPAPPHQTSPPFCL